MKKETYYQWVKATPEVVAKLSSSENYLIKSRKDKSERKFKFSAEWVDIIASNGGIEVLLPITGYLLTEEQMKDKEEVARINGVLLGLKICKEMWAQGSMSHENIYENEVIYKEELSSLINKLK